MKMNIVSLLIQPHVTLYHIQNVFLFFPYNKITYGGQLFFFFLFFYPIDFNCLDKTVKSV